VAALASVFVVSECLASVGIVHEARATTTPAKIAHLIRIGLSFSRYDMIFSNGFWRFLLAAAADRSSGVPDRNPGSKSFAPGWRAVQIRRRRSFRKARKSDDAASCPKLNPPDK
jgi:hypothetical protein